MNLHPKPPTKSHPWRRAMLDGKKLEEARRLQYPKRKPRIYASLKLRSYAQKLGFF